MCHSIQCPSVPCCYKLHVYSVLQVHCNFVLCNLWPLWFWCSSLVSPTKKKCERQVSFKLLCVSLRTDFVNTNNSWPTAPYLFWSPLHLSCLYLSIIHEFAFLSFFLALLSSTWSSSSHLSACSSWISTHLDLPALFCICTLLFTVSSVPPLHVSSSGHSPQRQWLAPTLTSHHFTRAFNFCPSKPHSRNDLRLIFHIWLLMVKMQGCINIIYPYWLSVSMFHWRLYNQQRLFLDDMMLAVRLVLLYLHVFVSQLRICCCVILSMMQKGHRGSKDTKVLKLKVYLFITGLLSRL